jgi:hypothetical protein
MRLMTRISLVCHIVTNSAIVDEWETVPIPKVLVQQTLIGAFLLLVSCFRVWSRLLTVKCCSLVSKLQQFTIRLLVRFR